MLDNNPTTTPTYDGVYSTILLENGLFETVWFGDDGDQQILNVTAGENKEEAHKRHIEEWEAENVH